MDKLKYIKLEQEDGTYSDSIPLSVDSNYVDINGNTLTNELKSKASNSDVNLKVSNLQSQISSLASGSPLAASSISEMIDTTRVYVNTTDGYWYYYDGDSWERGSVYQGIIDPELDKFKTGYDEALYITPADAVKDQIEELHTLINDDIVNKTENLFNVPFRSYYNIGNTNGVVSFSSSNVNTACTTIPIKVDASTAYYYAIDNYTSGSFYVFEYDENDTFITRSTITDNVFTTNENTDYILIKYNKSGSTEEIPIELNNHLCIAKYNGTLDFIPNHVVKVLNNSIDSDKIIDKSIDVEKLAFLKQDNTVNLINFYNFVPKAFFSTSNGKYGIDINNYNTCANKNYMPVTEFYDYLFYCKSSYSYTPDYFWYDENKAYISHESSSDYVTAPEGASYVRIRVYSYQHGTDFANEARYLMLINGQKKVNYSPAFGFYGDLVPNDELEQNIRSIINDKREDFIKLNKTKKLLNFAMCTDTHVEDLTVTGDQTGLLDIQVVNEIGKENWIDFAVHGGDVFNAYLTGTTSGSQGIQHGEAVKRIDDALRGFKDVKVPLYIARGNHDINYKYKPGYPEDIALAPAEKLTKSEFYMLAQHNFAQDVDNQFELNFYKDYKELKIRVIILDVYCKNSEVANFNHDTLNWLANTALKVDSDYACMIITHTTEDPAGSILQDLIYAYKTGGSYTNETLSVTVDYSSQGSRDFIGCICGHSHQESDSSTLGFWAITSNTSYKKTSSTLANNIYASVFTIDPDNHLIYKQKVGANGYNKIYDYSNLTSTNI